MVNGVIIGNHGDRRKFTRANSENMNVSLWSMLLIANMNNILMGILLTKNVCLWSMLLIENMNKSLMETARLMSTMFIKRSFMFSTRWKHEQKFDGDRPGGGKGDGGKGGHDDKGGGGDKGGHGGKGHSGIWRVACWLCGHTGHLLQDCWLGGKAKGKGGGTKDDSAQGYRLYHNKLCKFVLSSRGFSRLTIPTPTLAVISDVNVRGGNCQPGLQK
jgi:hypothetical protein